MQQTRTIALENIQARLTWMLFTAVVFLLISYLYLVNKSVYNIVQHNQEVKTISTLNSEVAALETEYMSLTSNKINLDYAHSLGFKDTPNSLSYIAKSPKAAALPHHNEI